MAKDYWQIGWDWAAANYHIDKKGRKNVYGDKLGAWLASLGHGGNHAAEGVAAFLNS